MGRKLMRVPLDFKWELNKVWDGYINPYWKLNKKCEACNGTGYSRKAKLFQDQWYGYAPFDPAEYGVEPLSLDSPKLQALAKWNIERSPEYYGTGELATGREIKRLWEHFSNKWCYHLSQADVDALLAAGRLMDFTHVARTDEQREIVKAKVAAGGNIWLPEPNGYHPTYQEVNEWSIGGFGHDSINSWVCIKARCKREGVFVECSYCNGSGNYWESDEDRQKCDGWEDYEPPTGEGYQLWETTSEGSPVTPVFETLEELCKYAAIHCSTFGHFKASAEKWREMLDEDFVAHQEGNMVFI